MVAGQHRDPAHALLAQQPDGLARRVARTIGKRQGAGERPVHRHEHDRLALVSRAQHRRQRRAARRCPRASKQALVADEHPAAAHVPFGAHAGHETRRAPPADGDPTVLSRMGHDRPGDGMLGARLDRRGVAQHLAGGRADGSTSVTRSSPFVSVPVLSNATTRTPASRSRCAPPLTSTPLRAAADSADTIETGVEMTSAHGQEITSSTSAR